MHSIYSLHLFTVFLLHVLVLHHHQGELCVRYLKTTSCYAATISGYYNSYVINICTCHIYDVTVVITINSSCITDYGFQVTDTKFSLKMV